MYSKTILHSLHVATKFCRTAPHVTDSALTDWTASARVRVIAVNTHAAVKAGVMRTIVDVRFAVGTSETLHNEDENDVNKPSYHTVKMSSGLKKLRKEKTNKK